MKKTLATFLLFALIMQGFSQSSVTIRNETTESFWVSVNNAYKDKKSPVSIELIEYTVKDLMDEFCLLTIFMGDDNQTAIEREIWLRDDFGNYTDLVYVIVQDRHGRYDLVPAGASGSVDAGFGFNMSVSDQSTSQSSANIGINVSISGQGTVPPPPPANRPKPRPHDTPPPPPQPQQCMYPMSPRDFSLAKEQIEKSTFDSDKVKIAKQIISVECINVAQLKEIMYLLTYEDDKLDIAKFAYPRLLDRNKAYLVNDSFIHSVTQDEWDEFLNQNR